MVAISINSKNYLTEYIFLTRLFKIILYDYLKIEIYSTFIGNKYILVSLSI